MWVLLHHFDCRLFVSRTFFSTYRSGTNWFFNRIYMKIALLFLTILCFNVGISQTSNSTNILSVYTYSIDEKINGEWKLGEEVKGEPGLLVVMKDISFIIYWKGVKEVYLLYDGESDSIGNMEVQTFKALDKDGKEVTLMVMPGQNGFNMLTLWSGNIRRNMLLRNN